MIHFFLALVRDAVISSGMSKEIRLSVPLNPAVYAGLRKRAAKATRAAGREAAIIIGEAVPAPCKCKGGKPAKKEAA